MCSINRLADVDAHQSLHRPTGVSNNSSKTLSIILLSLPDDLYHHLVSEFQLILTFSFSSSIINFSSVTSCAKALGMDPCEILLDFLI